MVAHKLKNTIVSFLWRFVPVSGYYACTSLWTFHYKDVMITDSPFWTSCISIKSKYVTAAAESANQHFSWSDMVRVAFSRYKIRWKEFVKNILTAPNVERSDQYKNRSIDQTETKINICLCLSDYPLWSKLNTGIVMFPWRCVKSGLA